MRDDAIVGAFTGGLLSLIPSAWLLLMVLIRRSSTIQLSHGVAVDAVGVTLSYTLIGLLGGATMALLRSVMLSRLGAYALGSFWGAVFALCSFRAVSGLELPTGAYALAVVLFSLAIGGHAGLQVRGAMLDP
jgi:hypothetical protein